MEFEFYRLVFEML